MKKIMMLAVVGVMALSTAFGQDLEAARKEAQKTYNAANSAYQAYVNKNMSEELKTARAEQAKALVAVNEIKMKLLSADEKYAEAAKELDAAQIAATKDRGKVAQATRSKANRAFEKAWKESKKDNDPEYVKAYSAYRLAIQNSQKTEAAFRGTDAEAEKLWAARSEANKALNEARKAERTAKLKKSAEGE